MRRIIGVLLLSFSCIFPAAYDPVRADVQILQRFWHIFLWNGLQFVHDPIANEQHAENEQPVQRHPGRRGDKYKKPRFMQQQQYYKNNNRVDRPKHQFTQRVAKR